MRLKVDGVGVKYGRFKALQDVSFDVGPGEVVSVVGPNGSGKSTLVKAIAQIQRPSEGRIFMDGKDMLKADINEIAKLVGYVPQNFHYLFFSTVMETVLLGRKPRIGWSISQHDLDVVQKALLDLNISDKADKFMDQLSGGEKQKVFIAKALAQEPELFLFDEPTSNLDLRHQIEVLEITKRLTKDQGASMIVALHDLNLASCYSDKVIILKKGRIFVQGEPGKVLTPENIREVYEVDVHVVEVGSGRYIVPSRVIGNNAAKNTAATVGEPALLDKQIV